MDFQEVLDDYSQEEQKKIVQLMIVFDDFIKEQSYFEILKSEKLQKLIVILVGEEEIGEPYELIEDAEALYRMLVFEIIQEIREQEGKPNYKKAREAVKKCLKGITDKELVSEYLEILEEEIEEYQEKE